MGQWENEQAKRMAESMQRQDFLAARLPPTCGGLVAPDAAMREGSAVQGIAAKVTPRLFAAALHQRRQAWGLRDSLRRMASRVVPARADCSEGVGATEDANPSLLVVVEQTIQALDEAHALMRDLEELI